ncbi:hypothetical protein JD969_18165 [Planctomycetota bacterium]|nr:hypothetical protein JD969_18165 [Planctomycetota bacterium]
MKNTLHIAFLTSILFLTLGCDDQTTTTPPAQKTNFWTAKIDRTMTEEDAVVITVDFTSDKSVIMSIPSVGNVALDKPQNSDHYQGRLVINAFRDPKFDDAPYAYRYILLSSNGARAHSGAGWEWNNETDLSKAINLHLSDGTYTFNNPIPLLTVGDTQLQLVAEYKDQN